MWHTELSWKEKDSLNSRRWVAAQWDCKLIDAPIDHNQVVVYEHRKEKHVHVHIYIDQVPIDGNLALRTDNNFYRQRFIIKQISQELDIPVMPERRRGTKNIDPRKEAVRQHIGDALQRILACLRGGEIANLLQKKICMCYMHNRGGTLRGVSFKVNGIGVRGVESRP
ncbi:relaxase/mobilization nuclease domain-containing protein [Hymenobacter negativus]|uniref:relaxase/mobilization nuclease domain-containing protein n=1 Tax=Hymenobacter negativus TaxID=2795026 RepID=UPI00397D2E21